MRQVHGGVVAPRKQVTKLGGRSGFHFISFSYQKLNRFLLYDHPHLTAKKHYSLFVTNLFRLRLLFGNPESTQTNFKLQCSMFEGQKKSHFFLYSLCKFLHLLSSDCYILRSGRSNRTNYSFRSVAMLMMIIVLHR